MSLTNQGGRGLKRSAAVDNDLFQGSLEEVRASTITFQMLKSHNRNMDLDCKVSGIGQTWSQRSKKLNRVAWRWKVMGKSRLVDHCQGPLVVG